MRSDWSRNTKIIFSGKSINDKCCFEAVGTWKLKRKVRILTRICELIESRQRREDEQHKVKKILRKINKEVRHTPNTNIFLRIYIYTYVSGSSISYRGSRWSSFYLNLKADSSLMKQAA